LHYQIRNPQGKLVRVVEGEVYDVAVDMRRSSPFFGRWVCARLSAANREMLWVPPGFAHGFLVVSPFAQVLYKCTDSYAPEHERSLRWNDPQLGISWPLQEVEGKVMLSAKDANGALFGSADALP
jgi:dTDP-4-dehydrorhamnose 3,5-epimerase